MRITSYLTLTLISSVLIFSSCKKVEGPGGSSAITGSVSGLILTNFGGSLEQEVTTVVCTHADGIGGSILDNSDYFLLNTPNGGTYYYVWYENTNWLGQDPALAGRTGIKVTYSNSESNVTIAINTAAAIDANASSDFNVSVTNDIVTITNVAFGEVIDADDINTPFAIDVSNQGKSISSSGLLSVIGDERVYIKYGEEDFYSESVRTNANGDYQFKGLTKGDYTVYAMSVDTLNAGLTFIEVAVDVLITDKKQVVTASDLFIVKD